MDGLEPPRPKDLIYSQASQPIAQHHNVVLGTGIEPVLPEWKSEVLTPRRTDHKKSLGGGLL